MTQFSPVSFRLLKSFTVTAIATLGVCGCHSHAEKVEEPVEVLGPNQLKVSADAMANLKLTTVQTSDFPEILPLTGKVSPTEDRTTVVPARAAGRIEAVYIASGETVKAGQALASIFSPDFIAAREEYLQSVRQDKKSSGEGSPSQDFKNLAHLSYRKLESLGLNKDDIEKLTQAAGKEDSGVGGNLIVRANRSGAVITKNAVVGNQVNQGDALFMIADLHEVWFLGDLYPDDVSKVKKDQEVVLDISSDQQLHGKVSFISPVIDPNSRTIKIRALINNPTLSLRSDMYLQGGLVLNHQKAILIPSQSIIREENANFIFKTSGPRNVEGHATGIEALKVKVTVAGERAGMSAISAGLADGDQVVSDGALLLNAALKSAGK